MRFVPPAQNDNQDHCPIKERCVSHKFLSCRSDLEKNQKDGNTHSTLPCSNSKTEEWLSP